MSNNVSEHIKDILAQISSSAGVYQFYDKKGDILYIGKAKNLKKRVSSYFTNKQEYGKTKVLVSKISDIKYIIVKNEIDALLLENNLIKKYQPRYNVLLKDSKTYPWICIKNEDFPRVFQTRNRVEDGSLYFGPYTSVGLVKVLLDFFHQLYPLRSCKYVLSNENIKAKKFEVCLEYHLKNCLGPCIANQKEEDYNLYIKHINQILKGDIRSVINHLKKIMKGFSDKMKFEDAQNVKDKIKLLNNYQTKSSIVSSKINNVDVFTIISNNYSGFINYLNIVSGAIIQAHTIELKKKLNESDEKLLQLAIIELRQRYLSNSKEIYCSHKIDFISNDIKISIPKIGDKKKLIDLSLRNAKFMLLDKEKLRFKNKARTSNKRILESLKNDLGMKAFPKHIECFDNSNIQGEHAVGACVVFKNGKPNKKDYRHFNIKTVEGPNDYASMEEVVYRRYNRLLLERKELPQLIIIDGGKGQLSSALISLEKLKLSNKISVIGIAKRLEEIYFPKDSTPLYLDKRSESLKLIQQLRDEAHRFGINHHRNKRIKAKFHSSLDDVTGVGPKTKEILLSHYKTAKKVFSADVKELEKLIGISRAEKIKGIFLKTKQK